VAHTALLNGQQINQSEDELYNVMDGSLCSRCHLKRKSAGSCQRLSSSSRKLLCCHLQYITRC